MSLEVNRVFVYGTLLPGYHGYDAFELDTRTKDLGPAYLSDALLYDVGHFPAVIFRTDNLPGLNPVKGRLLELTDPSVLNNLDRYEGFDPADPSGSLYTRKIAMVGGKKGFKVKAYVYEYNGGTRNLHLIDSGDYTSYRPPEE